MDFPVFLWLILLPLLASPLIYLVGRLTRNRPRWRLASWAATLALGVTWLPFVLTARALAQGTALQYSLGLISLRMDGLGLLMAAVTLGLGMLVALYCGPYIAKDVGQEKFYAVLAIMLSAVIGLCCATDLFNLWVWFEIMAVTSFLLVVFYRDQPASLEAGFKYLVQSASGSALIVVGIALIFAATGSLGLAQIRAAAVSSPLTIAAGVLLFIGYGVKAAFVPLHTWLPDAHSQAPSGISALLSGVVIEAGLLALLKVLAALFAVTPVWYALLIGVGAVNLLVGNLMALRQKQVKRLLAFSSVTHLGYMLLGFGITFYTRQSDGAQGSLFHLFNHGMMKGLAFFAVGVFIYTLYVAVGDHKPLMMEDLSGAARRYPLAALTLGLAVLGLGGLPPLAGFMSKWQIFVAGFRTGNPWLELLVIFAALNSVLSLAYYVPLINILYRQQLSPRVMNGKSMPWVMSVPLVLLSLVVIVLGIYPSLLNWLTVPAARALLSNLGV